MNWRSIETADFPTREEFECLTLDMLRAEVTNSDHMRDRIRREKQLILQKATANGIARRGLAPK